MKIEKDDLEEFAADIIGLWDNYRKTFDYWPEDLESDFADIMEKWRKKSEIH